LVISIIFEPMKMNQFFVFLFGCCLMACFPVAGFAQESDTLKKQDSSVSEIRIASDDSVRAPRFDSTLLTDTLLSDSLNALADSLINRPIKYYDGKIITDLLDRNQWINNSEPVYHIEIERDFRGKEFMFYVICILVLLLGIFKTIFSKYFNDLFRVYFNTSLRQTQLTDQLLQAKLPSLLLNVFF